MVVDDPSVIQHVLDARVEGFNKIYRRRDYRAADEITRLLMTVAFNRGQLSRWEVQNFSCEAVEQRLQQVAFRSNVPWVRAAWQVVEYGWVPGGPWTLEVVDSLQEAQRRARGRIACVSRGYDYSQKAYRVWSHYAGCQTLRSSVAVAPDACKHFVLTFSGG